MRELKTIEMKSLYLSILVCCLTTMVNGQSYSGSGNYNRLGLQGKVALFDINTSDFELEGETGFLGGFTSRGRLYNNFSMVYGIDFLAASVNIQTQSATQIEDTRFNILGAQLNLLLSYNIIDNHLAIDVGPALLVNGNLTLKNDNQETNIVSGYTNLTAEDIQTISNVNGFGVIGLTGGFEHVRLSLQYHYGFTNMFGKINKEGLDNIDVQANSFNGNASIISGGIVFYL